MRKLAMTVLLAGGIMTQAAPVENETDGKKRFSFLVGYEGIELRETSYRHDRATWNASGSAVAGPNNVTSLDGEMLSYAAVGLRWEAPIYKKWSASVGIAGLIAPSHRDEHSTMAGYLETRPTCAVYSESRWGAYASLGFTYAFDKRLYAGVDARVTGIAIESGWRWRGRDHQTDRDFPLFLSGGPKIGYRIGEHLNIEAHVHFGEKAFSTGLMLVIPF